MLELYTDAMQEVISKQITNSADMVGHTVLKAQRISNSFGSVYIAILFEDGYWMLFEPRRYDDNEVDIDILNNEAVGDYTTHILKKAGIISKEVYDAEHAEYMLNYYANIESIQRKNIMEWLPKYPDLIDKIKQM